MAKIKLDLHKLSVKSTIAFIFGITVIILALLVIFIGLGTETKVFNNLGPGSMDTIDKLCLPIGLVILAIGVLFILYFKEKTIVEVDTNYKICPECSKRLDEDANLCHHCGYIFNSK